MISGENLIKIRQDNKMSQEEFAEKLQIPINYLIDLENGKRKVPNRIGDRIAKVFNISNEQLDIDHSNETTLYIGDKIRALRESKGLSLAQLGTLTGLSITYLSELERGETTPSLTALRQIATVFNVPISLFIGNKRKNTLVIEKLKRARQNRNISQKELADKADLSPGLIGQLETGKVHPSLKTLEKICDALGVSVCSLILEQDEIEDIIGALSPELRDLLFQPQVQTILGSTCTMTPDKLKMVLNYIDMLNNPKFK
ncbi:MAG: hypothetical protein APF76_05960 [Desulfitibacter sp. BRH_c19]|nr:MAG: hypothetical protein APF76_05960 [Desulfitibacter sp. BRH_c19]